ncbi:two-component system, NarL family, sensor histidine kinase DesK [Streptomyces sp. DvalAA-14]|uniref:sensor histidine kinase n=1 Tax=unclassified Streptomyces TaxID=2593676 RepID=UPI00081B4C06|nr:MULTISPECIES: histidine kinase [unclassified Streptomyces]MYS23908.1 sensor histidine kinase [Streptomyces sp. SID4948]SCE40279.1 two-component system, NarL family, sensor histidine kinase DesK [Streptomyces sp. DvalAA-14]
MTVKGVGLGAVDLGAAAPPGDASGAPAASAAAKEPSCRRRWWRGGAGPVRDFDQEIERLKGPDGNALIPWLLTVTGPTADILNGKCALPWLAGAGVVAFCVLYISTIRTAFSRRYGSGPVPGRLLAALACLTLALAIGYGGNFIVLFVLVSLGVGSVSRSRQRLGLMLIPLSVAAGVSASVHHEGFWSTASLAYGTFLSGLVVSVIITLFHAVAQLKDTRQQLARAAVAEERMRFSRDLHDLLGHTLSVIVVKSEAARRLAPRDIDAALTQIGDIESVGRQALTEIREAVTGYREGSLSTELDRARSALTASDIEVVVQESGPPLPPQTEALLGWVVREGVTNVVRHSGASRTRIDLSSAGGRAHLTITDNGCGSPAPAPAPAPPHTGTGTGTGLRGLTERLAAAGGSLSCGPAPGGGFRVAAVLPVEEESPVEEETPA